NLLGILGEPRSLVGGQVFRAFALEERLNLGVAFLLDLFLGGRYALHRRVADDRQEQENDDQEGAEAEDERGDAAHLGEQFHRVEGTSRPAIAISVSIALLARRFHV